MVAEELEATITYKPNLHLDSQTLKLINSPTQNPGTGNPKPTPRTQNLKICLKF